MGDIAHALLPFGLDKAIEPVTKVIDPVVFHIPSSWKESLNAFFVALGPQYPEKYERGLKDLGAADKGRDSDQLSDDRWLAPPYCGPEELRKTERRQNDTEPLRMVHDFYRVDTGGLMGRECPVSALVYHILRWRSAQRPNPKIHLVGHSYGTKVVTLAGMEAIRLQRTIGLSSSEPSIASLVLFNPAFHPRELHYWVRDPTRNIFKASEAISDEFDLLQDIPRKAILYSGRDYATGRLFDLSQFIFANDVAQLLSVAPSGTDPVYNKFCDPVICARLLSPIRSLYNGVIALPASVLSGVFFWSGTKIINVVPDWISHATQHDFYDLGWSKGDGNTAVYPRTFLNAIDYWIPFGRVATNADADKMGVLRTAIPALGSIGMDRLVAKRWYTPLHSKSYIREFSGDDTDRRPGNGTEHHNFCKVAASLGSFKEGFAPHHFYSYDATLVMDTGTWGAGSHGDVRSTDHPSERHCRSIYTSDDTPKSERLLEKREYMFNFTYNFTRTPPIASQSGASDP
ncbi:MAG: hypothetical protein MRJ68_19860 [Nitrospira sp.]|nr:hypothetical protein [Nitrospira sp.]